MKLFRLGGKRFLAGMGILLLVGMLTGCSEAQKFSWERLKETHYRMVTGKSLKGKGELSPPGQAAASAPVGQAQTGGNTEAETGAGQESAKKQSSVSVVLYFANSTGDYLKAEERDIAFVPGLARAAVEELISGPRVKGITRTMPEGTKLRDINIQEGLCTVDLSKEFRENHWGGSSGEILTVYSLVNTLTQFPSVERVEILVEGQRVDTLAGHMDLTAPVYRNSQIIKDI